MPENNYYSIMKIIEKFSLKRKISLVIVCKNRSIEEIERFISMGHRDFAENKVQEAYKKWSILKNRYNNICLHFIGHLQNNKISKVLDLFDVIHSLDSLNLIEKISSQLYKKNYLDKKFFIQVNIGDEKSKYGFSLQNLDNDIQLIINKYKNLNIVGLMCLPPKNQESSYYFSKLANIAKKHDLVDLSMGMSNDYLSALENGATYLRIGSLLF